MDKKKLRFNSKWKNIEVTNKNKEQYVEAIVKWTLKDSVKDQIEHMKRAFMKLSSKRNNWFTPTELSLLLNGKKDINVDEWPTKRSILVDIQNQASLYNFLGGDEIIYQEERGQLLQFATGTNKAPLDGFDPAFTITLAEGMVVKMLFLPLTRVSTS